MSDICGPLCLRFPTGPMPKGKVVGGHVHYFCHVVFALNGPLSVAVLRKDLVILANGFPDTSAWVKGWPPPEQIDYLKLLDPSTASFYMNIERGRWHASRAEADGAMYVCAYPHLEPQAVGIENPGEWPPQKPWIITDADGVRYARIDKTISLEPTGWEPASQ
jgi:hypothetical protein